ncbi:tRNA (adenosine(37)-N6)-threonylcarbamoyltransferase complex dimerization subunit type 1 TsaB [Sphingomonas sp.]|uniref:tRNA (adenosine(37)-N6)-threonylcarbamoyltransferase complex dimerization subunit type 1 TsaB n=1 Tax=Sphingomonas sp. TaxID=28214 RepID=UPI002C9EB4B8|nr:tRNA (adenosine(37)-N6)-threonylcarbamoyltransferase complex dimerization subunit type 1 TsaB [Sphingomonas sp.]HTG38879.1 tRNA (adenosine(37)-N6)-threonylcarbamoyltransferase complex dimerization subunit type 1 TsaB [Sphingomonas sp.]
MRTLVIETATAACSVALLDGGQIVDARHEVVGRGHAERLLPMIAELAAGGRADAIRVDCGPGSFTGIRVGLAAARGLGLGWSVPVTGFSVLPLVAARAFADRIDAGALAVVMEGGHGEVFVQRFDRPLRPHGTFASLTPDAALAMLPSDLLIVGDGVRHLDRQGRSIEQRHPRAADIVLLPGDVAALAPTPIYGRAPDAKLPGAR